MHLDPDTLPAVFSFAPHADALELGEQVTKTSYESKEDLDDTLSFLAATVRAAYSAGAVSGKRQGGGRASSRGTTRGRTDDRSREYDNDSDYDGVDDFAAERRGWEREDRRARHEKRRGERRERRGSRRPAYDDDEF